MPLPWIELGLDAWLLLALGGGLAAMDGSAWPQSMASRPVVAATVGGALLGSAGDGLLLGVALEILWLPYPPFGAARRPEVGPASLMVGAAFAGAGGGTGVGFLSAVVVGWGLGWLGAVTRSWQWRWNGWLTAPPPSEPTDPERFESRHRWGPRLAFLRGFGVTAALLVPAVAAVGATARWASLPGNWPSLASSLAGWGLAAGLGLAAGAGIRALGGARRGALLTGASILGVLLVLVAW